MNEPPSPPSDALLQRSPLSTLLGAAAFYTCIPIPASWQLTFHGIARWAPVIGLAIAGVLALLDAALQWLGMPILTRSILLVVAWIAITGGLHLDGAMDTADGLAVFDPQRRLQVMTDSHTGAFGVMAAIAILLLKTGALVDLHSARWLALMAAAGWGRWAQLVAIIRYPYLKPEGKGALHKAAIQSGWAALPTLLLLLGLSGSAITPLGNCEAVGLSHPWHIGLAIALGGSTIALLTGAWFNRKLGGHTGDTYGAVVEWTEALLLGWLTIVL